ncbi:ribonuclease H-like domain-containing protein [Tanacetum coccineum]
MRRRKTLMYELILFMAIGEPFGANVADSINNPDAGNPLHVQNNDNTRNKYGFVDGSCLKSAYATSNVLAAQWDRCNAMINTVKQGGSSVVDYYHRLNSLWREFDALTKLPKCTSEPVRSALLTRDPLFDVKDAYITISSEESHIGILESCGASDAKLNATSFAAKTFSNNRRRFLIMSTNLLMHMWMLNVIKQTSVSPSSPSSFTPEQMKKLLNLINDNEHLTVSTVGMFNVMDATSLSITVRHPNGTGSESRGLYLFNMPPKPSTSLGESNMVISFHVSNVLWHNRLGHPVDQVLATLHSDLKISKSSSVHVCEICHRAKQTWEPFPLSDHKSKSLGGRVHLDLWGLYRVNSIEGPQSPNDEGRTSSVVGGSSPFPRHKTTDNSNMYQEEDIDVQTPGVRRSSRPSKFPTRLNDYVVSSNAKYSIEKDLIEDVYMTLPQEFDNDNGTKSKFDYFLYVKHVGYVFVALLVYVDGIVITGNDEIGIKDFKKKQRTISRSLASTTCKVIWLGNLLHGLGLKGLYPVDIFCDNSLAIQIAANPVFHEKTKHFELDVHLVREKVSAGIIKTIKVHTDMHNADIFTKCLGTVHHSLFCRNLGMKDIFAANNVDKDFKSKRVESTKASNPR